MFRGRHSRLAVLAAQVMFLRWICSRDPQQTVTDDVHALFLHKVYVRMMFAVSRTLVFGNTYPSSIFIRADQSVSRVCPCGTGWNPGSDPCMAQPQL